MATAQDVLRTAAAEIGVAESPAGSNQVKYNTDYYGRCVSGSAYPWCCVFVWWVFHALGADGLVTKTASCTALLNWMRGQGCQVETPAMAPGDLVFYNWTHGPKGTVANHVGIVESVDGKSFTAIEGNTSLGSDSNGGAVMRRVRKTNAVLAVARPRYQTETALVDNGFSAADAWAREAWEWAKARGLLDGTRPRDGVTRQELAVVLTRLEGGGA